MRHTFDARERDWAANSEGWTEQNVAFSEIELKRIDETVGDLCRRCSPPEHANQLRCTYDIDGHAVPIFEERPPWDDSPGEWIRLGVARLRYYRSRNEWQLYWMRADLQWHLYEPADPSPDLAKLVSIVDEDEFCCFFG